MSFIFRIVKNSSFLFLSKGFSQALFFFLMVYLARRLGSLEYGRLSFAMAFTTLGAILADFGMPTLTVREVARRKEEAQGLLGAMLVFKGLLALVAFLMMAFAIKAMGYPLETQKAVYIFAISSIAFTFTVLGNAVFRAFERTEFEVAVTFFGRVALIGFALVLFSFQASMFMTSLAFAGGNLIGLLLCWWLVVTKFLRPSFKGQKGLWPWLFKGSIPFFLTALFTEVYFRIDSVMLSLMKGDQVVGWYSASYRIIEGVALLIPHSFMGAMLPVFSQLSISSTDAFKKSVEGSLKTVLFLALPVCCGLYFLSEQVIITLFGQEYLPSISVLKILTWALFIIFFNCLLSYLLTALDKAHIWSLAVGVGAFLNVALNLILIPLLAQKGAALSTLITEVALAAITAFYALRQISFSWPLPILAKSFLATLLMGLTLHILKALSLFPLIFLGGIGYLGTFFMLCLVLPQDRLWIKEMWSKFIPFLKGVPL